MRGAKSRENEQCERGGCNSRIDRRKAFLESHISRVMARKCILDNITRRAVLGVHQSWDSINCQTFPSSSRGRNRSDENARKSAEFSELSKDFEARLTYDKLIKFRSFTELINTLKTEVISRLTNLSELKSPNIPTTSKLEYNEDNYLP